MSENNWYDKPYSEASKAKDTNGDRILRFIRGLPITYKAEIAGELDIHERTATKWIKRLIRDNQIEFVSTKNTTPTNAQKERIQEHLKRGMRINDFHNAKWYRAVEGGAHETL